MKKGASRGAIEAAFLDACHTELNALKPGNVHIYSAGHGMEVQTFERASRAAAPHIADETLRIGTRIFKATKASFEATNLNANLGIILLCVPLAKAAADVTYDVGLRRRLDLILSALDEEDANEAFAAIRLANPGGLGKVERGDVTFSNPKLTLLEAMQLAADRDRIARAFVTAYEDVFDVALPALREAQATGEGYTQAVTTLHMTLLAAFPDSHILRKWGLDRAEEVRQRARDLKPAWFPVATAKSFTTLAEFDRQLKELNLNPGTTADFVVATLFTERISEWKQP